MCSRQYCVIRYESASEFQMKIITNESHSVPGLHNCPWCPFPPRQLHGSGDVLEGGEVECSMGECWGIG